MSSLKKKFKLKGKAIASRLTGISCPIAGINWEPPVDEQEKARKLIVFLSDRRVLYNPFHMEIGDYVIDSVLRIRERLIHDLEEIRSDSVLRESLLAMSAACRKFMDENPRST